MKKYSCKRSPELGVKHMGDKHTPSVSVDKQAGINTGDKHAGVKQRRKHTANMHAAGIKHPPSTCNRKPTGVMNTDINTR